MILLLTDSYDKHTDLVAEKLTERGQQFFRFNLDTQSLRKTSIVFDGDFWSIQNRLGVVHSSDVRCVWLRRPFVELTLQEQDESDPNFKIWKGEWNKTLLGFYSKIRSVPWLNPLREAYRAENKYLQMEEAAKVGLHLPPTLVTNDKDRALHFVREHEKVALKLMTQEFYQDIDGQYKGIYVNLLRIDDFDDFGTWSENPVVLQAYIPKSFEVRYTVVGDTHHVCRIESQRSQVAQIDWRRYDIPNTPHFPILPPLEIQEKVTELLQNLELSYGALDFIVTPTEEWYFLEVNATGQWLWIEDLTGLNISNSIVDWLTQKHQEI
jgi:glutathione synthase/RimK-type ligase-like ATP-grasp enzyme